MATYATDTPQNQAVVDTMVDQLRSYAIALRGLNQKYAALLQYWFNGNPGGTSPANIINGYDAASTVPKSANIGLVGATQVTREGIQTLAGYLQTTDGMNDAAHVDVMVPFGGPGNL